MSVLGDHRSVFPSVSLATTASGGPECSFSLAVTAFGAFEFSPNTGKKKTTKINFLGPETAGWGGGLPREGVVVEKFVPSLERLSSLGFEGRKLGCPGNFAGMSRDPWEPSKSLC